MTRRIIRACISIIALFISVRGKSQNSNVGLFQQLSADFYMSPKWSLWSEEHLRSEKLFNDFYYYELKVGINYKVQKDFSVLFGAGEFNTYSNGGNFKTPIQSSEFRTWEQFVLTNQVSRIKFENRYRIEQRFKPDGYSNRFRYRLNASIPVNKPQIEDGAVYTIIYDEVFLRDKERFFERNRFVGALGYQFSKRFTLQLGWLRQYEYSNSGVGNTQDFLFTNFLLHFNQPNKK